MSGIGILVFSRELSMNKLWITHGLNTIHGTI